MRTQKLRVPMEAIIVVVHNAREFTEAAALALRREGYDVAGFADPICALNLLDETKKIEVDDHAVTFTPGRGNSVSLALMT